MKKTSRFRPWMIFVGVFVLLAVALAILLSLDFEEKKVTIVSEGNVEGPWVYTLYSNKTSVITKYTGEEADVTVPSKLGRSKVVGLGTKDDPKKSSSTPDPKGPFYDNLHLLSVTVPDTVTYIGSTCFSGCKNLRKVVLPDTVETLGNSAFYLCYDLADIRMPKNLTAIHGSCFAYCRALKSVEIPDTVKNIYSRAFDNCSGLTSFTANNVEEIGSAAFSKCKNLVSVSFGDKLGKIGAKAFEKCEKLQNFSVIGGETLSFGDECFLDCTGLTAFTLPENAYRISATAFRGCTGLISVTLLSKDLGVDTEKADAPFKDCPISEIHVGSKVNWIPSHLFRDCTVLTSVTLPDTLSGIGANSFRGCTGLQEITVPVGVLELDPFAFGECVNLTKAVFNAKRCQTVYDAGMEGGPFTGCTALRELVIGKEVELLSKDFMADNAAIENVTFLGTVKEVEDGALYKSLWLQNQKDELVILGDSLLKYNGSAEKVTVPQNVKRIGRGCFKGNTALKEVLLPDGTVSVGKQAFFHCENLCSVNLPESLLTVGDWAFSGTALREITLPENIIQIQPGTFSECTALQKITLPGKLTSIEKDAFSGCTALLSVKFPSTLEKIMERAFVGCSALSFADIPDSVTFVGEYAFAGSAKTVILGTGVTSFTPYCFGASLGMDVDTVIYYRGTVSMYDSNFEDTKDKIVATVYTFLPDKPKGDGNYWHYDENQNPVLWEK